MADPDFADRLYHGQPFYDMVRLAPQLKSVAAQLVLRDRYETLYGIHDHAIEDPTRPIPMAAHWDAEDAFSGSLLDERLEHFVDKQVGKWFNISLPEFLELPTEIVTRMIEIATKQKNIEHNNVETQLQNLGIQPGGNKP